MRGGIDAKKKPLAENAARGFERLVGKSGLSWPVGVGVADLVKGSFDELLSLVAEVVVDGGHGLNDTGSGAGKGELAVGDFAFVEGEGAVAEHDEGAIGEIAGFIFVEIEDDFFVGELVVADFLGIVLELLVVGLGVGRYRSGRRRRQSR